MKSIWTIRKRRRQGIHLINKTRKSFEMKLHQKLLLWKSMWKLSEAQLGKCVECRQWTSRREISIILKTQITLVDKWTVKIETNSSLNRIWNASSCCLSHANVPHSHTMGNPFFRMIDFHLYPLHPFTELMAFFCGSWKSWNRVNKKIGIFIFMTELEPLNM